MVHKIRRILDLGLELLVALVMAILVLDVTWQVITRFILRNPSKFTEELATFLMIWVGLLGGSVALNRKAHLGVDYFVCKLPQTGRKWAEAASFLIIALFSLFVLVIGGCRVVIQTFALGQVSPALGLKMGMVYLALPISGFFILVYSIDYLVKALKEIPGQSRRSGDSGLGDSKIHPG